MTGQAVNHRSPATTLAVSAGAFGSLDSALNVAFSDLVDDLDLAVVDLRWVIISYVLVFGLGLLTMGRLGDRIGHRRVLAAGAALAAVAFVACATAPNLPGLLAARAVQGVATAMVMASAPALLTLDAAGHPASATRAVARFQTSAAVGLLAGPLLGGVLVSVDSWRGVFWFRVPLSLLVLGLALSRPRARPLARPVVPTPSGTTGSQRQRIPRDTSFVALNLLAVGASATAFAIWLFVPILLTESFSYSATTAGLALAVNPLATAAASSLAGRVQPSPALGLLIQAAGLGLISTARPSAVIVGAALTGTGLGLFVVPNMAQIMHRLGRRQQGTAGGLAQFDRTAGIVLASLAFSAIFARQQTGSSFVAGFSASFATASATTVLLAGLAAFVAAKTPIGAVGSGND